MRKQAKPIRTLFLVAGPLAAGLILLFLDLEPGRPEVTRTAAVAVWMALWWLSEAAPLPVTALLPVALFPLSGVMSGKQVAPIYFNHIIFLFIGGFIIALAMQRWNLHKRIALAIISLIGFSPNRILLGFMLATAFLSMWISNTATTMMMVPIALGIILRLEETGGEGARRFSIGLLLAIAYGASIGGIATLIGTPPNLSFVRILGIMFEGAPEISFVGWMKMALPLSAVMLAVAWLYLSRVFCRNLKGFAPDREAFAREQRELGPMLFEEKAVLFVFAATAILWVTRSDVTFGAVTIPGWAGLLGLRDMVDDGTVAITMAVLLFLLPSRRHERGRLLAWEDVAKLPWGIVLLFGGGFALASGFAESGLSQWIGTRFEGAADMNPIIIVALICLTVTFLTELTSNTATTEMLLPILGAVAVGMGVNPLLLMIPATLSASCAFMLPVATPPNAIVFGAKRITIAQMSRTGLVMNMVGIVLITGTVLLLGKLAFDIDLMQAPDWAVPR